ncbi:Glucan 1,3-beta-glucosidase [Alternaria alternata]|nr:Glucan 1,3-beta-glucosidase [Alternaria alternata]
MIFSRALVALSLCASAIAAPTWITPSIFDAANQGRPGDIVDGKVFTQDATGLEANASQSSPCARSLGMTQHLVSSATTGIRGLDGKTSTRSNSPASTSFVFLSASGHTTRSVRLMSAVQPSTSTPLLIGREA